MQIAAVRHLASGQQALADIVAVHLLAPPIAEAWPHRLAVHIEYLARQRAGCGPSLAGGMAMMVGCELGLDLVEQILFDDRFVLTGMNLPAMDDFAQIDPVLEDQGKPRGVERDAAMGDALARYPALGEDRSRSAAAPSSHILLPQAEEARAVPVHAGDVARHCRKATIGHALVDHAAFDHHDLVSFAGPLAGEGPIHQEEVSRRVAEAFGKERAGSRIFGATLKALRRARQNSDTLRDSDEFWYTLAQKSDPPVRSRAKEQGPTLKAENISLMEIVAALSIAREDNAGGHDDELVRSAAQLLGFRRVGPDLRARLQLGLMAEWAQSPTCS